MVGVFGVVGVVGEFVVGLTWLVWRLVVGVAIVVGVLFYSF